MDKRIQDYLEQGVERLKNSGVSYPEKEARWILLYIKGFSRFSDLERIHNLNNEEVERYFYCIDARSQRVPIEYIFERSFFYGLDLEVSPDVLIPRQETELLADNICKYLERHGSQIKTFRDVCCGSGCLGLAIKKHFPNIQVVLSDICPHALAVAKRNAIRNHLDVEFVQGDLFTPFTTLCDAFVCNPPYLSYREVVLADAEVRCQEPWLALVGPESGYGFYRRIAEELPMFLRPGGIGWLEIGCSQGELLKELFVNSGCSSVFLEQDLFGRDRFIQIFR